MLLTTSILFSNQVYFLSVCSQSSSARDWCWFLWATERIIKILSSWKTFEKRQSDSQLLWIVISLHSVYILCHFSSVTDYAAGQMSGFQFPGGLEIFLILFWPKSPPSHWIPATLSPMVKQPLTIHICHIPLVLRVMHGAIFPLFHVA